MAGIRLGRRTALCTLLFLIIPVCCGTVTVKVNPKVEADGGTTAKLPCAYSGTALPDVVVGWHIDYENQRVRVAYRKNSGERMSDTGTPLVDRVTLEEDLTLTIKSVKPSDPTKYYCQVTAGKDGSGEGETTLDVFVAPQKPEIKKPSQAISVGGQTSSEVGTCVATNGFPSPRIIWFKDNQPLPEVKDRREKTYMVLSTVKETSGLYTIKNSLYMQPTKADKDSILHCTVEYSLAGEKNKNIQKKSEPMKIELRYPFEKIMFNLFNPTVVKEGDNVTLKCETDGNPQPPFDFTKDGRKLSGVDGSLILENVKRTDSGIYVCSAFDAENYDEKSNSTVLNVNYIDEMSVTPTGNQIIDLGKQVKWQCKTKASKNHTVLWKKDSTVLSQDGTLSIGNVGYEHAGEYMCVGAVPEVPGLTAQTIVKLTVKGKPKIGTPVVGEVAKEGDEVTLKCSANGFPKPQFTWSASGKESISVEENMVVSSLTLKTTPEIMKSGVKCEVSNEFGKDSKDFSVEVKQANSAEVLLSGNPVLTSAEKQQEGSSAVVVAVVVCVLLLLLLVAFFYCLSKKTTICGKKDKKEAATAQVNNIVVEMKTDKANEEAGLLNKKINTEQ
ncbi:basal cell adhesion molecule isoform X1 [Xiphophorus maculatus]|uniref:Basal cell adhesion molecule (Lutheran blood group) n=1 Tax=Xiphophorus maculatus TaxID=8083 RepID=A0A3B5QN51_XIPMA|nr:basal cell adhesion molecule isoform X1 [Xiphophorus maculatus]